MLLLVARPPLHKVIVMPGDCAENRQRLDQLFVFDALVSITFGLIGLLLPHKLIVAWSSDDGKSYNQGAHEAFRLYACLRIAVGWIILHIRSVDDGRFRRSVCEALVWCYAIQAAVVLRAQFTDRHTWINWVAGALLLLIGGSYGVFRYGRGGNLIKIYELPTSLNSSC